MIPIGVGAYPQASEQDVARALTVPNVAVLVMGVPNRERHDIAIAFRDLGADVTRRFDPGDVQLDLSQTPEQQAAVWYDWILGGLTPDAFRKIYRRAVGPNETIATGDETNWPWHVAFEIALCKKLNAVGIDYSWGSIAVGNVDPIPFATVFAPILAIAQSTNYHPYAAPGRWTLEDEPNRDFARRPMAWYQACVARGVRFPPLFAGEIGTFYPWTKQGMDSVASVALLKQIATMLTSWIGVGIRVIGCCLFAVGAEGDMGKDWNVATIALDLIGKINKENHMPNVGTGYLKFKGDPANLGEPLEDEIYHAQGTPHETSLAIFENGRATWSKDSNETIAIRKDGTIWRDGGNDQANAGKVQKAAGPFR